MGKRNRVVSVAFSVIVATLTFWTICSPMVACAAEPVKIGFITSLSGTFGDIGLALKDGFIFYMDQIGRKAGGRDIETIVEDAGTLQVDRSLTKARKLIQKDRIDILAGVIDSGSAYALMSVVNQYKIPYVIANAGADDLTQRKASPLIVRPAFVNSAGGHALGDWAYKKGYRRAVITGSDFAAGYEHLGGFCRTFTKAGGKIVQEIWQPLGTQDFAPYLANITRDTDVVVAWYSGIDALRFVKQYAEYGLKEKIPLIAKGGVVDDSILQKQAEAAEGLVTEYHYSYLTDNPENKTFKEAYIKKFGRRPDFYVEQGYVSAQAIAEALRVTKGQVKGEEFIKVMRSFQIKAPRGILKFDKFGGPVHTINIRKVEKIGNEWHNVIFTSYPEVSQFWTWSPEEYMKMPPYVEMKGKWAN